MKRLFYYSSTCFKEKMLADQADKTFYRGCELNGLIMVPEIPHFIDLLSSYLHREHIVRGVLALICSHPQAIKAYLLDVLVRLRKGVEDTTCEGYIRRQRMEALIASCKQLKDLRKTEQHLVVLKEFVRVSMPFLRGMLGSTAATR